MRKFVKSSSSSLLFSNKKATAAAKSARKYATTTTGSSTKLNLKHAEYDAVVIGGGHNGLVCAGYLARDKPNAKVLVLERRHCVGGAAVTEEIVPGFKFSRASYLCSLLRPQVIADFNLKNRIKFYERNPSSFTPTMEANRHLLLGPNAQFNKDQIAKFSKKDAENYGKYEHTLEKYAAALENILDMPPYDPFEGLDPETRQTKINMLKTLITDKGQRESLTALVSEIANLGAHKIPEFYEILTAPATKLLNKWFESDILKSTLATDAIIGEFAAPSTPGRYVTV